ncbi:MAG: transporter [Culicoidibacterales bacterium]
MFEINLANLVVSFPEVRVVLIFAVSIFFIVLMIQKKISTLIALPAMGILTALIASIGVLPAAGLFDMPAGLDAAGKAVVKMGIFNGVIMDGAKMLSGAIVAAIFGAAFAKLLTKSGVVESLIKKAAELAGDRPLVIALVFYVATVVIFSSIGGLGAVILVGSIALPIMVSVGLSEVLAGSIVLLGLSTGGIMNPANFATFAAILAPTMGNDANKAFSEIAQMSIAIFVIIFVVSLVYIIFSVRKGGFVRAWAKMPEVSAPTHKCPWYLLITPLIPVGIIVTSTLAKVSVPAEVAILLGILYLLFLSKLPGKMNQLTSAFVEGTQDVSGAIVLLIGLGILIKGFQFFPVAIIITPTIAFMVSYLTNPLTYVIGFTLATPLVLYRGPLNTFGIGGALPVIFATAGFSPIAIIWALRATGNMQGFGDPTNSQNIWVANFLKIDPNEITKKLFLLGIVMSLLVLLYAVFILGINLTTAV